MLQSRRTTLGEGAWVPVSERCKAGFAPGATEDANGGLEGQRWQE